MNLNTNQIEAIQLLINSFSGSKYLFYTEDVDTVLQNLSICWLLEYDIYIAPNLQIILAKLCQFDLRQIHISFTGHFS